MDYYRLSANKSKNQLYILSSALVFSVIVGILSSLYSLSFLVIFAGIWVSGVILFALFTKTESTIIFMGILLLVSLFLIPEISIAGIGLRLDDGLVIFLGLGILYVTIKHPEKISTKINKFIFVYGCYLALITIANIIFGDLPPILMLFSIKEIQYLIYFFAFIFIMNSEWSRKNFQRIFFTLSIVTMAWGLYQLLFDASVGFYGIGLLSETSSSQSGGVFFLISMFFLYFINSEKGFKKRVLYFLLFIVSVGLIFATISRTSILAFVISYVVYLGFTLLRMSVKRVIISVYILVLTSPAIYFVLKDYLQKIFDRLQRIDAGTTVRTNKWDYLLSYSSDLGKIFGEGRGFTQTITGGLTLAADSQYVRNFLELGYVGSSLFIMSMLAIVIFALRNMKKYYAESLFLLLITCGFMVMSVTHEVFLVAIQASFYWILVGAFVGKIMHDKRKKTLM